ncbi:MAG: uracil phosphoribosyltransferase [Chthonomonas sp.]|nr:uracil phosphoribosyltransferase [Chthonomonas sp.]
MPVIVISHPLAQHLLTTLRDVRTEPAQFRQVSNNLATLLAIEATRDLELSVRDVQTPLEKVEAPILGKRLAVVPILRAGLGMLESALDLFPEVSVGYIGLERDETTARAHTYYCKLPSLEGCMTLCFDPMLATGGSASQAISFLKAKGADDIRFVSIISAPEGIDRLESDHPDVPIYTTSVDRELNANKYIVPGLGDFGDRLYGTP